MNKTFDRRTRGVMDTLFLFKYVDQVKCLQGRFNLANTKTVCQITFLFIYAINTLAFAIALQWIKAEISE